MDASNPNLKQRCAHGTLFRTLYLLVLLSDRTDIQGAAA